MPMRGMQLFIFLNNPFDRLGSKQQEKLWLLPAPAHSSTVDFVEPQQATRQLLELYPSNIFLFFFLSELKFLMKGSQKKSSKSSPC